ncbi:mitochondrial trans-2-enoyl-CoA reductase 2 [Yamadazyma tenuis ATCC 10573]|uniref:enoyl-[acyl-carrier-protein] reductase n=2 Tax=Candida tenuis TaxID=2315449 RepID=G3BAY6_CANTC|nr:mitochondrial trans-2-enoyl-CoA reductase 2 [Yamadazyma tenuis ATCC 10573]EGV61483.1 mitochondrial trans-2-enoyl-CoA reductase 2 [Yamadazyma tenuis ATCC 10573]
MITSHAVMIRQHGEPADVLFTQSYTIDDEHLAPNAVIVKVLASPINPSDINQIQGVYPSQPQKTTQYGTSFPSFVCGNEGLFEVVKVGASVTSVAPGDWALPLRVCSGTWRTYAEFSDDVLFKIPSPAQSTARGKTPLTLQQGAALTVNPLSAYLMLTHFVEPKPGNWFIQNGGNSAVGKFASQMGRLLGLNSISVIRDRPNLDEVKQQLHDTYGATHVITEEENNSREFSGVVKKWLSESGGSLQLGLNCVGGKSSTGVARKLQDNGIMLTYGGMSFQPVILPTSLHIFKNITSAGFWCTRIVEENLQLKKEILEKIISWYEDGELLEAASTASEYTGGDLASFYSERIADSKSGKQVVVNAVE